MFTRVIVFISDVSEKVLGSIGEKLGWLLSKLCTGLKTYSDAVIVRGWLSLGTLILPTLPQDVYRKCPAS